MYAVAVLIPSCDKYCDLWKPFFNLFWMHWNDCPYEVYLGSNHKELNHERVKTIKVGDDISWSDGIIAMLDVIEADYVVFMLEDFFLRSKVNTCQIVNYIRILDNLNGAFLRLVPNPGPDIKIEGSPIGIISKESAYRVSTQGAVWKRRVLYTLLKKGESAWEFELNGTIRSRVLDDAFYSATSPILTYENHVVERGKWFPKEAKKFEMMDIGCDFNQRKIMTPMQFYVWHIDHIVSKISSAVPVNIKRTIRRFANEIAKQN